MFGDALNRIYHLRKHLHPAEVAAGHRESLRRHAEIVQRWATPNSFGLPASAVLEDNGDSGE
jgi:hypothetical protein